jgi:predicted pyridoxine 5'-phosphate oxidase superfamily flavin-nucleotide-binding protein
MLWGTFNEDFGTSSRAENKGFDCQPQARRLDPLSRERVRGPNSSPHSVRIIGATHYTSLLVSSGLNRLT